MVKHLFYAAGHTSPFRTSARQGGERSGPCRDVRVTELCEVKGDVTIPELKRQHNDAHDPSDYRPADENRTVLESCARLSGKWFGREDDGNVKKRPSGSLRENARRLTRTDDYCDCYFRSEATWWNGLGSKEKVSPEDRYSIDQCTRYTIPTIPVQIDSYSTRNGL